MKSKYTVYFINTHCMRDGYTYYITTSKERARQLFDEEYNKISQDHKIMFIQGK